MNEVLYARPYPDMVSSLQKKMGSQGADVLHAAVGICGEAAELAVARSVEDIVEELGDMEFYVEACFQALGGRLVTDYPLVLDQGDPAGMQCLSTAPTYLMVMAGHLLDKAKKSWVYEKPVDQVGLRTDLLRLEVAMRVLRELIQVSRTDVLRANQNKLGKRYPGGVYTNQAAITRADKGGVQEEIIHQRV
jgi:hypothetical protein